MSEQLLTTEEVAEYLAVPVRTIYRWRAHGTAPVGYRVGKHIRFRREDVDQWLTQQRDDRTPDAAA